MRVLTYNAGSSSLKFQLDDDRRDARPPLRGAVSDVGSGAFLHWSCGERRVQNPVAAHDHAQAAELVFELLGDRTQGCESLLIGIDLIAHRVVHGGEALHQSLRITDAVLATLETASDLAPLHNPSALAVIRVCRARLPEVPMVAVFDTTFFHALPAVARTYALPAEWRQSYGIRRYGFHGIAHHYLDERYRQIAGSGRGAKVISFQLGHGCSVAAIRDGHAQDTSMGYTPLEGLVMSTRSGDLDPGILLHLAAQGLSWQALQYGLHNASGLLGLSGVSGDMRQLLELETQGHAGARLAVDAFCRRARHYLGAYLALLGGADAIVFGGGIGEHAPAIRERICADMAWCGLRLDEQANQRAIGVESRISADGSEPAVYVIPVDEETLIANEARAVPAGPVGRRMHA